jgi:capsular exopolysaccharide synthesis family protein
LNPRQYLRLLRAYRLLIAVSIVVCTTAAGVLAWVRPPTYAAHIQFFVSTNPNIHGSSLSEDYAGILLSQQRVVSYAQLVASTPVIQAISKRLGLPPQRFNSNITASVPAGTSLIDVTVTDRSAQRTKAIAAALGDQFPAFINGLETPKGAQRSPVDVSVTSPAKLPTAPVSPRKLLYLTLGVLVGIVLGIGAAVLREALDRRVRDVYDAADITGSPVLGSVVEYKRAKHQPLVMANDPASEWAEEFRRLRTNLHSLLTKSAVRPLVVSSALESEGKTFVAANLGIAFAQASHRVILVDADLRHSTLADLMGLDAGVGLTNVLAGNLPLTGALRTWRPGLPLEVLAAGPPHESPSELLGSREFAALLDEIGERAEIVILDAPALLPTTEAAVLARLSLGAILVIRAGSTRAHQLDQAVECLDGVEARVLGVVMNRLSARAVPPRYGRYPLVERLPGGDTRLAPETPPLNV